MAKLRLKLAGEALEFFQTVGSKGSKARARNHSSAKLSEWAKLGGRPPKKKKAHSKSAGNGMPIPKRVKLLRPTLQIFADELTHDSQRIRKHLIAEFNIAPHELLKKYKGGTPVFHNCVAWALAHLNMERGPLRHTRAIVKVEEEVYRITEYGKVLLKRHPEVLTLKDLRD